MKIKKNVNVRRFWNPEIRNKIEISFECASLLSDGCVVGALRSRACGLWVSYRLAYPPPSSSPFLIIYPPPSPIQPQGDEERPSPRNGGGLGGGRRCGEVRCSEASGMWMAEKRGLEKKEEKGRRDKGIRNQDLQYATLEELIRSFKIQNAKERWWWRLRL